VGGADAITARSQQYLEVASNFGSNAKKEAGILGELLNKGIKCNSMFLIILLRKHIAD